MKPYHEYTNWMLREYFAREQDFAQDGQIGVDEFLSRTIRRATEISRGKAEELNLTVCAIVIRSLPSDQVLILREVFGKYAQESTMDAVRICAKTNNLKEKNVWNAVRTVSQEIARARCLI